MRSALTRYKLNALPAALAAAIVVLCSPPVLPQSSPTAATTVAAGENAHPSAQALATQLKSARAAVAAAPDDANAHLQLGEVLHKFGRDQEASQEYLKATTLKHDLFVAYHQLSQSTSDKELLDKAIAQLIALQEKQPHELMLRVALSELYEREKSYYPAAKPLIEIQYDNAVPLKYKPRVEARIHYLLTKAHEVQLKEQDQPVANDEELDVVPAPLPPSSLRKGLTASKIKDNRELKGMGHVPLLP